MKLLCILLIFMSNLVLAKTQMSTKGFDETLCKEKIVTQIIKEYPSLEDWNYWVTQTDFPYEFYDYEINFAKNNAWLIYFAKVDFLGNDGDCIVESIENIQDI